MFNWFSKKEDFNLLVDIHSHLLPGLDDGVKSYDESLDILRAFSDLGYKKVVTTPHIYPDYYPNTPLTIREKMVELESRKREAELDIEVEAAAEYFIGAELLNILDEGGEIMSFGDGRFVLLETSFSVKPLIFDEVIFKLKSAGYIPVLAHPERYEYIDSDLAWLKQIKEQGVLLQVSTPSLVKAYGTQVQKIAQKILSEKLVDFLGSDIHRLSQWQRLEKSLTVKIVPQTLYNNSLL